MKNKLVPSFILKNFTEKRYNGEFNAVTMLIDIVGFTGTTEKLIKHGKEGEEVLSRIINSLFQPALDSIYKYNGWVIGFAGDSFTAVFSENSISSIYAASEIQSLISNFILKTKFGDFKLNSRIGLSFGKIEWVIIRHKPQNVFYFRGEGINKAVLSERQCNPGEIIIDSKLKKIVGKHISFYKINRGFYGFNHIKDDVLMENPVNIPEFTNEILKQFVPKTILELKEIGEFRRIVSVFLSFGNVKDINLFISNILDITDKYGGYFNKIDFGDKGGLILILFGAPTGIEKPAIRAIDFALELKSLLAGTADIRMGITSGVVYAGIVGGHKRSEYTAIGKVINLSVRFAMKANWGDISIDSKTCNEIGNLYIVSKKKTLKFKGFSNKVSTFSVKSKCKLKEKLFYGKSIGRNNEIRNLKKYINPINYGKFGGIVYIDGNAGIGKSRLVDSIKRGLDKKRYNWFYMPSDEIIRGSLNPVIGFLKDYFSQKPGNLYSTNKKNFEIKIKNLIKETRDKEIKIELERTKSIIGALINLYWNNSIYEKLDAKGKYENTLYAIKNLIKAESLRKPVIIELEDGHWVDNDTVELLKVLTRNVEKYPFILISACRLNDDGSKYRFPLINVKSESVLLKSLSKNMAKILIESQLNNRVSKELFDLIWHKSEGNPFYIEQIILYLVEAESIVFRKNHYELIRGEIEIPGKISNIIISRIDRLNVKLKDLIKMASVLGHIFCIQVLSAVYNDISFGDELKRGKEEAIWITISEFNYIFRHALIRETIYSMQLKSILRKLHKKAAMVIEKLYGEDIEIHYGELAYHYEMAEIDSKAKQYLEKSAEYASKQYKNREAIAYYNRLLKYVDDPAESISLNYNIARIYELIGQWDKAEKMYLENIKSSRKINNRKIILENYNYLGTVKWKKGLYEEALKIFKRILESYRNIDDRKNMGIIFGGIGIVYWRQGKYKKAMKYFKKRLIITKELKDKHGISSVYGHMGMIYRNQSRYKDAINCYKKQLRFAKLIGNKRIIGRNIGNMGLVYWMQEDYKKAEECFQTYYEIAREIGDKQGISIAVGNMGIIYYIENKLDKAMKSFKTHLRMGEEIGDQRSVCHALNNIASIYETLKDYSNMELCYNKALNIAEKTGDRREINISLYGMGNLYKALNNYSRSEYYYKKAIAIGRKLNFIHHLSEEIFNLAELYFRMNKIKKAELTVKESIKLAKGINKKDVVFEGEKLLEELKKRKRT